MLELLKIGTLCVLVRPCRAFLQGFPPCTRLPLSRRFLQGTCPATRRPLLKKGSIRKLFLRAGNTLFMERHRIRNAGALNFRRSIYGHRVPPPSRTLFAGRPPCTRRPLLKKGSIRKLFLRMGNIFLTERQRIRDAGTVDFLEPVYGYRAPSPLWVFCALVHGGRHRRKPKGFRKMPPTCTT